MLCVPLPAKRFIRVLGPGVVSMPVRSIVDGAVVPKKQHALGAQLERELDSAQTTIVLAVRGVQVQTMFSGRLAGAGPALRPVGKVSRIRVPPSEIPGVQVIRPGCQLPRTVNDDRRQACSAHQVAIVLVEARAGCDADEYQADTLKKR